MVGHAKGLRMDDRVAAASLYDSDEHLWLEQQVQLLESGNVAALDRAHLAEFLTAMALRDKRELQSRLTVLLAHILKVRFQPEQISRSWVNTINVQQREIRILLKAMPSLVPYVGRVFDEAYEDAVKQAAGETGLPVAQFGLPRQVISFQDAMGLDALSLPIP